MVKAVAKERWTRAHASYIKKTFTTGRYGEKAGIATCFHMMKKMPEPKPVRWPDSKSVQTDYKHITQYMCKLTGEYKMIPTNLSELDQIRLYKEAEKKRRDAFNSGRKVEYCENLLRLRNRAYDRMGHRNPDEQEVKWLEKYDAHLEKLGLNLEYEKAPEGTVKEELIESRRFKVMDRITARASGTFCLRFLVRVVCVCLRFA